MNSAPDAPSHEPVSDYPALPHNVAINAVDRAQWADIVALVANGFGLGGQLARDTGNPTLEVVGTGSMIGGALLGALSVAQYLQSTSAVGNLNVPEQGRILGRSLVRVLATEDLEIGAAAAQAAYPGLVASAVLFNAGMYLVIHSGGNAPQNAVGIALAALGAIGVYGLRSGPHFTNSLVQYGSDASAAEHTKTLLADKTIKKRVGQNRMRYATRNKTNSR